MWKRMVKLALVSVTLANVGFLVTTPEPAAARHPIKQCACPVGSGSGSCIMYFQMGCEDDNDCPCTPE